MKTTDAIKIKTFTDALNTSEKNFNPLNYICANWDGFFWAITEVDLHFGLVKLERLVENSEGEYKTSVAWISFYGIKDVFK